MPYQFVEYDTPEWTEYVTDTLRQIKESFEEQKPTLSASAIRAAENLFLAIDGLLDLSCRLEPASLPKVYISLLAVVLMSDNPNLIKNCLHITQEIINYHNKMSYARSEDGFYDAMIAMTDESLGDMKQ